MSLLATIFFLSVVMMTKGEDAIAQNLDRPALSEELYLFDVYSDACVDRITASLDRQGVTVLHSFKVNVFVDVVVARTLFPLVNRYSRFNVAIFDTCFKGISKFFTQTHTDTGTQHTDTQHTDTQYTNTHTDTHTDTDRQTNRHTHTHIHIQICARARIHAHIRARIHIHIYTHTRCTRMLACAYSDTYEKSLYQAI